MQAKFLYRIVYAVAACVLTLVSFIHPAQAAPLPDEPQPNQMDGTVVYMPFLQVSPIPAWREINTGSASGRGITQSNVAASYPTIVAAPANSAAAGSLYMSWEDGTASNHEIYVKRWDGKNWVEVGSGSASGGGISNTSGNSLYPRMAIAPDGTLYVCWIESVSGNNEIYVRRWNGSNWAEVGINSASGNGISGNNGSSFFPSIAIAPNGTPYIAWEDTTNGKSEIYIKRWTGEHWLEVGTNSAKNTGISHTTYGAYNASIAIGSDNTPYVAWQEGNGYSLRPQIFIRRFDDTSWVEAGSSSASGSGISKTNGKSASRPAVAAGPNGMIYVAWYDETDGNEEIFVRSWNGSAWSEVGSGSAGGGGISKTSGMSRFPAVSVAPNGTPYVAWFDNTNGNGEIFVRSWNGSNWIEVGTGSATGGGVSANTGSSSYPSISISPSGIPYLAWQDSTSGHLEIYVKYFGL